MANYLQTVEDINSSLIKTGFPTKVIHQDGISFLEIQRDNFLVVTVDQAFGIRIHAEGFFQFHSIIQWDESSKVALVVKELIEMEEIYG